MDIFKNNFDNALSKSIAEELLGEILSGTLKPGDKIVEAAYAERFNTSRSPVREAIYLLTTEGLIERLPRKGAYIKGYSIDEIRDLLDVRNTIELLAVERIDNPQNQKELLEEMDSLLKEMEKYDSNLDYIYKNYRFHYLLIRFSCSNVLIDIYSKIALPLLRIQGIHFKNNEMIGKSIREHKEIYKTLKENDLVQLKSILKKHTEDVLFSVKKQLF